MFRQIQPSRAKRVFSMLTVPGCMQPDHQPSNKKQRLVRATGAAVGVGAALMENCIPGSGGRLMVFTGGPCTTGPGTVVGLTLEESIRTHRVHPPPPHASLHSQAHYTEQTPCGRLFVFAVPAADTNTPWTHVLGCTSQQTKSA